ncbi:MAG: sugar transferase [Nanoarchaeota archaeon]|nr:sugar transferase [Nanoarchaeota archaeon]
MGFLYWREIKQKGEEIYIPKIRTLRENSSSIHSIELSKNGKYLHSNHDFISPLHRFLRKYWIDELPQFYSLLKGDLKLIGVRAKEPKINSAYTPFFRKKLEEEVKHSLIDITYSLDKSRDLSDPRTLEALYRLYLRKYNNNSFRTDLEFLCGFGRNILKRKFSE